MAEIERCVHGLANCPPCQRATEPRWVLEYDDYGVPVAMRWHPGTPFAPESESEKP